MKNKLAIGIAVLAASILSLSAQAQEKLKLEVGYNVGIPMGGFKTNDISSPSFRGAFGEISYAINPKFWLGLNAGYQSYYQKFDRQLYKQEGQTISAVKTNSIDVMPLLLRGTYLPMAGTTSGGIQPYISAGAGVNFVSYQQYLGEFGGAEYAVPIAVQAGAGVMIPVGSKNTSIKVGADYNYSGYTSGEEKINLGNLGVHAGLIFPIK
jgi:hypothetical protein